MKEEYKIERWNEQMQRWFIIETSQDELWATMMIAENRSWYPKETFRLVRVTCTEEVIG